MYFVGSAGKLAQDRKGFLSCRALKQRALASKMRRTCEGISPERTFPSRRIETFAAHALVCA
jgi:hypothetical protein